MALQTAYYIIGIIFMSLMILLMIVGVIAVLVIKARVNAIQRKIEEKIHAVTTLAHAGAEIAGAAKDLVTGHKPPEDC